MVIESCVVRYMCDAQWKYDILIEKKKTKTSDIFKPWNKSRFKS
jgi:hypothetical protein